MLIWSFIFWGIFLINSSSNLFIFRHGYRLSKAIDNYDLAMFIYKYNFIKYLWIKFKLALTLCASFNMSGSGCSTWGESSKLSAAASNAQIREGLQSILSISLLQRLGIGRLIPLPLPLPNKTKRVATDVCANNNVASWSTWAVNSSVYISITCTRHMQSKEKKEKKRNINVQCPHTM